jgi:hypothetical protein
MDRPAHRQRLTTTASPRRYDREQPWWEASIASSRTCINKQSQHTSESISYQIDRSTAIHHHHVTHGAIGLKSKRVSLLTASPRSQEGAVWVGGWLAHLGQRYHGHNRPIQIGGLQQGGVSARHEARAEALQHFQRLNCEEVPEVIVVHVVDLHNHGKYYQIVGTSIQPDTSDSNKHCIR